METHLAHNGEKLAQRGGQHWRQRSETLGKRVPWERRVTEPLLLWASSHTYMLMYMVIMYMLMSTVPQSATLACDNHPT